MPEYTVRQGDTTASIAHEHGFLWETIWNHDNNTELRNRWRDNPNALHPGDTIFVPGRTVKEESGNTDQRHRFRRVGLPERLRIYLLDRDHEPRADVPYTLEIGEDSFSGTTNAEGLIEHFIAPDIQEGRLLVGESREEEHELRIGHLDPLDEITGYQARLKNLGLYFGEITGEMDLLTETAIKEFQRRHGLEETGGMDADTRRTLDEVHDA